MPCARNSVISANSVSRFPRDRMRAITSDRFDWIKTSGMMSGMIAIG